MFRALDRLRTLGGLVQAMKMRYLHHAENQRKASTEHTVPGPEYLVVGKLNASMVVSITLLRAWCRLAVGGAPEKKLEMDCRNGMLFFEAL